MKSLAFETLLQLAGAVFLLATPILAQNPGQISDPVEFHAYQTAINESDPSAKANDLEYFLLDHPRTTVKKNVLEQLMDAYQAASDPLKAR